KTAPLLTLSLAPADADWGTVALPPNLAIVGTVNMDESAHGFSRKVLDRAFALELSDVDLRLWCEITDAQATIPWPVRAWTARLSSLAERANASASDRTTIENVVNVLIEANTI